MKKCKYQPCPHKVYKDGLCRFAWLATRPLIPNLPTKRTYLNDAYPQHFSKSDIRRGEVFDELIDICSEPVKVS